MLQRFTSKKYFLVSLAKYHLTKGQSPPVPPYSFFTRPLFGKECLYIAEAQPEITVIGGGRIGGDLDLTSGDNLSQNREDVDKSFHLNALQQRHRPGQRIFMLRKPAIPSVIIETHHAWDPREEARWTRGEPWPAFGAAVAAALVQALGEG